MCICMYVYMYGCDRVYNYVCKIEYTDPPQLLLHCFVLHRHTVYYKILSWNNYMDFDRLCCFSVVTVTMRFITYLILT